MSKTTIELEPEEFGRVLIALNWYILDREECAEREEREGSGIFDASPEEHREAGKEASELLEKLRRLI